MQAARFGKSARKMTGFRVETRGNCKIPERNGQGLRPSVQFVAQQISQNMGYDGASNRSPFLKEGLMSSNASNDRRPDDRLPVKFVRPPRKAALPHFHI